MSSPQSRYLLAQCSMRLGRLREAEEALRPDDSKVYNHQLALSATPLPASVLCHYRHDWCSDQELGRPSLGP